MLQELSNLVVADNTGAKRAMCFRILKQRKEYAHLGDIIRVAIKEASPTSSIKKGSVATAVIVRTGNPIRRADGSTVHFDQNACVLVDSKLNLDETAGSFLRATHRLGVHVELTDNSNPLLGVYLENRARLTCVNAAGNDYGIILFDSCDRHFSAPLPQTTSGAIERIFM